MPPRINKAWGQWVKDRRKAARFTKRELAARAGIDPSYVTGIEYGLVPRMDKVREIGNVFRSPDEALVLAGFIPDGIQSVRILRMAESDDIPLISELRALIAVLKSLPYRKQKEISKTIRSLVEGLTGEPSRRTL